MPRQMPDPASKPITPKQQHVLDLITDYWIREHRSPSIREISDMLGLKGPNAAAGHCRALTRKGALVKREGTSARGLLPIAIRDHLSQLGSSREVAGK
jgi:SOS-response transcriptional repressor LexA